MVEYYVYMTWVDTFIQYRECLGLGDRSKFFSRIICIGVGAPWLPTEW